MFRARRLEQMLDTPARIYYKYEGVSPAGSHKPNTAVAQAYYNKQAGIRKLVTETGAGQWGSSLAMACAFFGLDCKVYMVRASYAQKPYRKILMETWGSEVVPSPVVIGTANDGGVARTFVYPKHGQSAEKQASDEYECHRWAVDQTGFDPTAAATNTVQTGRPVARTDYARAQVACLEGRGYTVR